MLSKHSYRQHGTISLILAIVAVIMNFGNSFAKETTFYDAPFTDGSYSNFTFDSSSVWKLDSEKGLTACGIDYKGNVISGSSRATSYDIFLYSAKKAKLSFEWAASGFNAMKSYVEVQIQYSDNGIWDTLEVPVWPEGNDGEFVNSGEIDIMPWAGNVAKISFLYKSGSSPENTGTLHIRNLKIEGEVKDNFKVFWHSNNDDYGTVNLSPNNGYNTFTEGTNIKVTATPNSGYYLSSFSYIKSTTDSFPIDAVPVQVTENPFEFTLDANYNITANFLPNPRVTVSTMVMRLIEDGTLVYDNSIGSIDIIPQKTTYNKGDKIYIYAKGGEETSGKGKFEYFEINGERFDTGIMEYVVGTEDINIIAVFSRAMPHKVIRSFYRRLPDGSLMEYPENEFKPIGITVYPYNLDKYAGDEFTIRLDVDDRYVEEVEQLSIAGVEYDYPADGSAIKYVMGAEDLDIKVIVRHKEIKFIPTILYYKGYDIASEDGTGMVTFTAEGKYGRPEAGDKISVKTQAVDNYRYKVSKIEYKTYAGSKSFYGDSFEEYTFSDEFPFTVTVIRRPVSLSSHVGFINNDGEFEENKEYGTVNYKYEDYNVIEDNLVLTATPAKNKEFCYFIVNDKVITENPGTVVMDKEQMDCYTVFRNIPIVPVEHVYKVSRNGNFTEAGSEVGSVVIDPQKDEYEPYEVVTVKALPAQGFHNSKLLLQQHTGYPVNTEGVNELELSLLPGTFDIYAYFMPNKVVVSSKVMEETQSGELIENPEAGEVSVTNIYHYSDILFGESALVNARSTKGYEFEYLLINGQKYTDDYLTFAVNDETLDVVAVFKESRYTITTHKVEGSAWDKDAVESDDAGVISISPAKDYYSHGESVIINLEAAKLHNIHSYKINNEYTTYVEAERMIWFQHTMESDLDLTVYFEPIKKIEARVEAMEVDGYDYTDIDISEVGKIIFSDGETRYEVTSTKNNTVSFYKDAVVHVEVIPNAGYLFEGVSWMQEVSGTSFDIKWSYPETFRFFFRNVGKQHNYTLTKSVAHTEAGQWTTSPGSISSNVAEGTAPSPGDVITFTAVPADGFEFDYFVIGDHNTNRYYDKEVKYVVGEYDYNLTATAFFRCTLPSIVIGDFDKRDLLYYTYTPVPVGNLDNWRVYYRPGTDVTVRYDMPEEITSLYSYIFSTVDGIVYTENPFHVVVNKDVIIVPEISSGWYSDWHNYTDYNQENGVITLYEKVSDSNVHWVINNKYAFSTTKKGTFDINAMSEFAKGSAHAVALIDYETGFHEYWDVVTAPEVNYFPAEIDESYTRLGKEVFLISPKASEDVEIEYEVGARGSDGTYKSIGWLPFMTYAEFYPTFEGAAYVEQGTPDYKVLAIRAQGVGTTIQNNKKIYSKTVVIPSYEAIQSGVGIINADANGNGELYDLNGHRVYGNPHPGIYIRRIGSHVEKINIR